jgi:hypothetical protein
MDQARRFGVLIDVGRKVLFTRCCIAGWVMVGRLYRVYIYLYVLSSTKHVVIHRYGGGRVGLDCDGM